jgi:hypothetical protein
MFTSIRSIYNAIGVMLFLVALYIVLEHGQAASGVITSVASAGGHLLGVLQGNVKNV